MTSTIAALLQLASSLLVGTLHNPGMSLEAQQKVVLAASQTVQLSTQALAKIDFAVPQNTGMWPTARELQVAPYIDARGGYVRLGAGVQMNASTISFGDMNSDGLDDAMVVVKRVMTNGSSSYDLAALLNQGGIMFNIADTPLVGDAQAPDHRIDAGQLVANGNRYVLLGNQLIKQ